MCLKREIILNMIQNTSEVIAVYIEQHLSKKIDIETIKNTHGNSKSAPECFKDDSYIYFLYNESDQVIYIGETGTNVKDRLFNNGNGAHKSKPWFHEVRYIKYYKDNKMDQYNRKLIERALILKYRNNYNLYNEE